MKLSAWHASGKALRLVIRITTQTQPSGTVIAIDGWLADADLGELRRIRELAQGSLVLRLGGLDGCAPGGIRLLQDWLHEGAKLESASPFLQMVLEPPPRKPDSTASGATALKAATI